MNKNISFNNILKKITKREMISIYIVLLFIAVALGSIFVSPRAYREVTGEGDIALKNVFAPYDFTYSWEEDEAKTKIKREIAIREVPFYLSRDLSVENKVKQKINDKLNQIDKIKQSNIALEDKVSIINKKLDNKLSEKSIRVFLESDNIQEFQSELESVLNDVYAIGYMDEERKDFLKEKEEKNLLIFYGDTDIELKKNIDDILDRSEIESILEEYLVKKESLSKKGKQAFSEIISINLAGNLVPDEKRTDAERVKAEKNTAPVYKKWKVEKNEIIIEKGKRVEARHVAQMMQLRSLFKQVLLPRFF